MHIPLTALGCNARAIQLVLIPKDHIILFVMIVLFIKVHFSNRQLLICGVNKIVFGGGMSTKKKSIGVYKLTLSVPGDRNGTLLVEPVRDSKGVLCGHKFLYSEGRGAFRTDGFMTGTEEDKAPEALSKCLIQVKNTKLLKEKGLKNCPSCQGSGVSIEISDIGKPRKLCATCKGTGVVPIKGEAPEDSITITYKEET